MNNNDVMIYAFLADAVAKGHDPSYEEIAERLELHTNTVNVGVRRLEESGHIRIEHRNGCRCHFELTELTPPMIDRLRGWLYRFQGRESLRRFLVAAAAKRIYDKAGQVRRMQVDDPGFVEARDQLWAQYPDMRDLVAVWEPEIAAEIEHGLDRLLDWEKGHEQVRSMA